MPRLTTSSNNQRYHKRAAGTYIVPAALCITVSWIHKLNRFNTPFQRSVVRFAAAQQGDRLHLHNALYRIQG